MAQDLPQEERIVMSDEGGKRKTRSLNLEIKYHHVQTAVISKPRSTHTWAEGWADWRADVPGSKAIFSAPMGHSWAFHSSHDTKDVNVVSCSYMTLSPLIYQTCGCMYTHRELSRIPEWKEGGVRERTCRWVKCYLKSHYPSDNP